MLTANAIKQQAYALGFDLCGIAPADAFPELTYLQDWIANGYAGEMAYMARTADRRADVRAVLPGARSVIVTGTVYSTAEEREKPRVRIEAGAGGVPAAEIASALHADASAPAEGIVARYARGDDYHDVLKRRLEDLLAWMRRESTEPFEAKAYVDTGPVQERVYAQYAGLGWIGKNTCLINPGLGSWLFLAEIICTLTLDTDAQGLEQCGTCTRCLDACPTGALRDAYVLDSTRCLSYLTIELRGPIPAELRPALGAHIYGCDVCQDVCPYNQVPAASSDGAWQPRHGLERARLADLWRRSDVDLLQLTRNSAMRRAKLTGLRRNLAVAIGNSGDPEAMRAVAESREDQPTVQDPLVQEHVRWAQRQPV